MHVFNQVLVSTQEGGDVGISGSSCPACVLEKAKNRKHSFLVACDMVSVVLVL